MKKNDLLMFELLHDKPFKLQIAYAKVFACTFASFHIHVFLGERAQQKTEEREK